MSFRLFKLIKMLDNYGVSKVSEHLIKASAEKLKNGELEQFVNYYLSFNFEINNRYPFIIIYYINKSEYLKVSDIIKTKYFETMPSSFAFELLNDGYNFGEYMVNYLISKLDKEDMNRLLTKMSLGSYTKYKNGYYPALISKLQKYHNINSLVIIYTNIKEMKKDIIGLLISDYTKEEIKNFALKFNDYSDIKELVQLLIESNRVNEALNIIVELAVKHKNIIEDPFFKYYKKIFRTDIDDNNVLLSFAEDANEKGTEYITKVEEEIVKADNYDLMYYWFITNDGTNNKKYEMIDKFINKGIYLGKLLLILDSKYQKHLIEKTFELNKLNILINDLIANIDNNSIAELDEILNIIFTIKADYKLSKCACIKLLGYNTKYYTTLLNNYEYTIEERHEILKNINLNENYSLLAIYGSYYLTGNKNMIVNESIVKENNQVLKLLRKTNL